MPNRKSDSLTRYTQIPSPIGPILLTSDGASLTGLYMSEAMPGPDVRGLEAWGVPETPGGWIPDDNATPFEVAREQLTAYFDGTLREFDLPLSMEGSDFQRHVWHALLDIPFGTTISYGELARRVGNPNGSRAVGLANGRNPIAVIVPCHRVIGSNGKLTGYGGGLPRKAALLDFEFSVALNGPVPFPPVPGTEATEETLLSHSR